MSWVLRGPWCLFPARFCGFGFDGESFLAALGLLASSRPAWICWRRSCRVSMAPWIVVDWSWKARLGECLETCWSLWADVGLHNQVWAAEAPTAAAFLSEPNSVAGALLWSREKVGGGPSNRLTRSCPFRQAYTPANSESLPLVVLRRIDDLEISLLQEIFLTFLMFVLESKIRCWGNFESSRLKPRDALSLPLCSAVRRMPGPGKAGTGRVFVTLGVFRRSIAEEVLQRYETLDGAEVPREAQLPCHCAWARILSLNCSRRGLLFLGWRWGPNTRGGLSFQGPLKSVHDSCPPEEPDSLPDDTELSPFLVSMHADHVGRLQAFM